MWFVNVRSMFSHADSFSHHVLGEPVTSGDRSGSHKVLSSSPDHLLPIAGHGNLHQTDLSEYSILCRTFRKNLSQGQGCFGRVSEQAYLSCFRNKLPYALLLGYTEQTPVFRCSMFPGRTPLTGPFLCLNCRGNGHPLGSNFDAWTRIDLAIRSVRGLKGRGHGQMQTILLLYEKHQHEIVFSLPLIAFSLM